MAALLPDRAEEVAKLRKDFRAAEKAEDEEFERQMEQSESRLAGAHNARTERVQGEYSGADGNGDKHRENVGQAIA